MSTSPREGTDTMTERASPATATLLEVLVDGFEKNEVIRGFHLRTLPLADEPAAVHKFEAFVAEATAWKGAPRREERSGPRRVVSWADLELRQAGRGLMVRVRVSRFQDWWNAADTWAGDPMGPLFDWLEQERRSGR